MNQYFPEPVVRRNPKGTLVEYLQYEILDSLFKNKEASKLGFIGGTAIRILHQSPRFSEDLDFDNFALSYRNFEVLLGKTCKDMKLKGFLIEYKMVQRGAYHCYIRFPSILYETGISSNQEEKILIRIDTELKKKHYQQSTFVLNGFSIYRKIMVAPPSILLAQKMITVLQRKREKGRDLFDVSFLCGIAKPDFSYVGKLLSLKKDKFLNLFRDRIDQLDLNFLAKDVEPFLFYPQQKERILTFKEYFGQLDL